MEFKEIYWEITEKCNNNCPHCFLNNERNKTEREDVKKITAWIINTKPSRVRIGGGDPQCCIKDTLYAINKFQQAKIPVHLITNKIPQTSFPNIEFIQITLDEYHDTQNLIKDVENFRQKNKTTKLRGVITVSDSNIHKLEEKLNLLIKAGFDAAILCRIIKEKESIKAKYFLDKKYGEFIKFYLKNKQNKKIDLFVDCSTNPYTKQIVKNKTNTYNFEGCPAGKYTITIKQNGEIIPCWFTRNKVIGTINNLDPTKAFNTFHNHNPPGCKICIWAEEVLTNDPLKQLVEKRLNPKKLDKNKDRFVSISKKIITKEIYGNLVFSNSRKNVQKILDEEATKVIYTCDGTPTEKSIKKQLGQQFFKELLNDGLIVLLEKKEKQVVIPKSICRERNYLASPDEIFFEITEKCNLKCKHCYNISTNQEELSTSQIKTLFKDLSQRGVFAVNIGGGEPTTRPDLIELIAYGADCNLRMTISTNCVLLNENYVNQLKKAGLHSLQISLEGPEKENDLIRGKNHFEIASNSAKIIKKGGIPFAVSLVPTKLNYTKVYETAKIAKKWGASRFRATRLVPTNKFTKKNLLTKEEYDNVVSQLIKAQSLQEKDFIIDIDESFKCLNPNLKDIKLPTIYDPFEKDSSCVAGKTLCGILPDGTVTPCAYLRISCGNIKEKSFFEIWEKSSVLTNLRINEIPDCKECKNYKTECKGGCRAVAYYQTGNLFAKDYICNGVVK